MNRSRSHHGRGSRGRAVAPHGAKKALPQVYLKGGDKLLPEIYMTDHGARKGLTTKWIVSTMLAGLVGIGAIGTVIYASIKSEKKPSGDGSLVSELRLMGEKAMKPFKPLLIDRRTGARTASGKTHRMIVTAKGLSTRHIIHDSVANKRGDREYVSIKPYARVVSTFATARPDDMTKIPPFDPFKLYANTSKLGEQKKGAPLADSSNASLATGELPVQIQAKDENFQLSDREALRLVTIAAADYETDLLAKAEEQEIQTGESEPGEIQTYGGENTTVLAKSLIEQQAEPDEAERHEVKVRRGDSFGALMQRAGAEAWQAQQIIAAMNGIYPASQIKTGQKLRYVAVPKPDNVAKTEPVEIALYEGRKHLVTVARNEAGDYVASKEPSVTSFHGRKSSYPRRASLYQSFYHSGLTQALSPQAIIKLLRIHAYDTDFKRRTQPGDSFEAFFDTRSNFRTTEHKPNELLYTSVSISGERREFYRFRLPDGSIDYYDRKGNSAKKFLMRKPVRGSRVRLSSGFGYRIHPILKKRKLHAGTDWAGPIGTPILAAGDGTMEFVGRKGGYGNYLRIRHANGYKTAYAHLHRYAKGVKKGLKVRQGQVIGYLGNSGRSTGPHLHFEVLVNNKHVNAMTIPVPRGLNLKGHLRAQFIKERDRIDELRSRDPVTTRVASAN